ncbi:MAG: copper chaperone [Watsoniomyces obsoletus]|nr:MAG: copper chaperone [Watsoniomyces obsoletus]
MVGSANLLSTPGHPAAGSAAPKATAAHSMSDVTGEYNEYDGLRPPRLGPGGRSMSASNPAGAARSAPFAVSAPRGSFSSDLHGPMGPSRPFNIRTDIGASTHKFSVMSEEPLNTEQRLNSLKDRLNKELKIKEGSENLLEALNTKKAKQAKDQIAKVESELNSSYRKIAELKVQIEELQQSQEPETSARSRIANLFTKGGLRSPSTTAEAVSSKEPEDSIEAESPTFALSELLQSLEAEGMQSDYYVERANQLVDLFKRHATLKYDLAWSVFGLRMQTLLLSDSREVVAAGYRVTRYAIVDRPSLQTIRSFNTDYLVMLSLVKESKASIEREQAVKFIRSFLDVKDGVREISRAVVRTLVAVAEHVDDRLRSICIETLAEILIRDPPLVVSAGGIDPLTDALADGTYQVPESLVTAFLYLLDTPGGRRYLRAGQNLEVLFAAFTDSLALHVPEQRLKANARVIAAVLKTWPGLMALSMYDFRAIRTLVFSLRYPYQATQDIIMELLFDLLRIKLPSWSSSFLAGRRLTTYGRVANLRSDDLLQTPSRTVDEKDPQHSLVDHFLTLTLAVLFQSGLPKILLGLLNGTVEASLRRKATLLLGEALKMASRLLPSMYNVPSQMLPELFSWAANFDIDKRCLATNAIYQVDSVNRTLQRSSSTNAMPPGKGGGGGLEVRDKTRPTEPTRLQISAQVDETQFRVHLVESQVLNSGNYSKWRWDIMQAIVEGPLLNQRRLDEAVRATKFLKRLMAFYRPFKYRFSEIKNTKPNQRYVRVGCALIKTLLQTVEGVRFLVESKLLRQLAECLAQVDPASGMASSAPLFSASHLAETLSCGYFSFIGTMSRDSTGLILLEKWRIINICYHLIDRQDRNDLIKLLLVNVDFSLPSHFRIMLSKALTGSTKEIRIFATNLLRSYALHGPDSTSKTGTATGDVSGYYSDWAIRMLITQLYDPEVEVCETAVKILEEACNRRECLEFVVQCCPALDHLGEIGAPLLLRFLSTSLGYRYLDDLDYITQEMDDWFLGRNDTYVTLVEASLARALQEPEKTRSTTDASASGRPPGVVPPHFYRELTRTTEGCKLLRDKGHFGEFVQTVRTHRLEDNDSEIITKVKGCLWAIGNVGSMELGAPFIEESQVVEVIIEIAERSAVLSMRGTAFFVLGLISRSLHGSEMLDACGWDGATTTMGVSLGRYIPLDLGRLLSVRWYLQITSLEELTADDED